MKRHQADKRPRRCTSEPCMTVPPVTCNMSSLQFPLPFIYIKVFVGQRHTIVNQILIMTNLHYTGVILLVFLLKVGVNLILKIYTRNIIPTLKGY